MCSKVTQDICMIMHFGSSWHSMGKTGKTVIGVTWNTLVGKHQIIFYCVWRNGKVDFELWKIITTLTIITFTKVNNMSI